MSPGNGRGGDEERQLRECRARLEELEEQLDSILYAVSHDLRAPLRAVNSFSDLLARRYGDELDPKAREYLDRVLGASDRMGRMLEALLQLSRLRRATLEPCLVEGAEVVDRALARVRATVEERAAGVAVSGDLPRLRVEPERAVDVVAELLANALEFVPEGERPEIEISAYRGPRGVGVVVGDRGIGVRPRDAERVFQLFQRAVGQEYAGEGAGLALVRQVARQHGGDAWVRPRDAGGAEFVVTFGQAGRRDEGVPGSEGTDGEGPEREEGPGSGS